MRFSPLFSLALGAVGLIGSASAAVLIEQTTIQGSPFFAVTFTEEVHFVVLQSASPSVFAIVFKNLSPGVSATYGSMGNDTISYQVNGINYTADISVMMPSVSPGDRFSAGDGLIEFSGVSVMTGDIITINPGTLTYHYIEDYGTAMFGYFSGEVFIYGNEGPALTAPTLISVPEPSAAVLAGIGALGLLRRRRR
jgi:hypothetical protein